MRILFLGDVYARSGRDAVFQFLPELKAKLAPDIIIVNAENAAHGRGITPKICKELFAAGVSCVTAGDHAWDQREIIPYFNQEKRLIRVINMPRGTAGSGAYLHILPDGRKALIAHCAGQVFMGEFNSPFEPIDDLLSKEALGKTVNAIFIDFHAEATSEKMAMAHFVDGRASAVIGTHTHIPTADAHILDGGTAYMTDAGMCGDYNSVIGAQKDVPVHKFVRKAKPAARMSPASGKASVCGAFIVTSDETGLAKSIEPVRIGGILKPSE